MATPSNLAGYREFLRLRLGIQTPLERWRLYADTGTPYVWYDKTGAERTDAPPSGMQPTWQPDPSNYKLDSAVSNGASTANRQIGLADAGSIRQVAVPAQTADGPYIIDLAAVPGFTDRSINSIRRAWWFDGAETHQRLIPTILSSLDRIDSQYIGESPSSARRFAIEGYKLYILPAPSADGYFEFMAGCGILAPQDDTDGFDQIPTDYDPSVLYIALIELAKMLPNDVEMRSRAEAFTPDATAALEKLSAWFNGGSSDEIEPSLIFDARMMRRWGRRRY